MTTERQSAASRANGAKSRGPKTPETRANSSRNSLRHGLASRHTMVLECENLDDFQKMIEVHAAAYQPANPAEQYLVDEMVAADWRLQRIRSIEASLLDAKTRRQPEAEDPGTRADPA